MDSLKLLQLRKSMGENNIDAFVLNKPENILYVSGFYGSFGYVIITQDRLILATDFRYEEMAKSMQTNFEVLRVDEMNTIYKLIQELNVNNIAIEEEYISVYELSNFKNNLYGFRFVYGSQFIRQLRSIKTGKEIENIKKACVLTDKVFEYFLNYIRVGMIELDIVEELNFVMRKFGATNPLFVSLISGKKTSMPHGTADKKKIEYGDFVTLDMGCEYNNYGSDMTRTVIVGKATDEQKKIYNIVLEAQMRAYNGIQIGMTGNQSDALARDYIEEHGYGQYFGHGLGHGIGINLGDLPKLNNGVAGKNVIEKNMIFSIEPGIYIPGFGGVRIEDTVLMTESGCKSLMKSTKKLIEI